MPWSGREQIPWFGEGECPHEETPSQRSLTSSERVETGQPAVNGLLPGKSFQGHDYEREPEIGCAKHAASTEGQAHSGSGRHVH